MKRKVIYSLTVAAALLLAAGLWATHRNGSLTVDMSKTTTDTNAPPVVLAKEIAHAAGEHKLLLLEFGSSDSCPPCVAFQQYVASTPAFAAYAKSNLDFIRLDYPDRHPLRPDTQATNDLLAKQFGIEGFPTFVALDEKGAKFWEMEGFTNLDILKPANFIGLLNQVKPASR